MSHFAKELLECSYSVLSSCQGRKFSGARISGKRDQSFLAQ